MGTREDRKSWTDRFGDALDAFGDDTLGSNSEEEETWAFDTFVGDFDATNHTKTPSDYFFDEMSSGEEEQTDTTALLPQDRPAPLGIQAEEPQQVTGFDPNHRMIPMTESEFKWNIFAILMVCWIGEAARGLTVSSLYLYFTYLGGSSYLYSLSVSSFSVGRMLGGMSLGALSNRLSIRSCIMISMIICAIGNLLYFLAVLATPDPSLSMQYDVNSHHTVGVYMAFVGRFMVGYGSSTVVLVRVFLSMITSSAERTKYISYSNAAQYVGSSLLPGVAVVLFFVPIFFIGDLQVSGYNSPGLLLVILDVACFFLVYFFMSPIDPKKLHGKEELKSKSESITKEDQPKAAELPPEQKRLQTIAGILFFFFNFDTRSAVSIIETAGTTMYLRTLTPPCASDRTRATAFFFLLGFVGFIVFFFVNRLNKIFSSLTLLASSMFVIGTGLFLLINFQAIEGDDDIDNYPNDDPISGGNFIEHMAPWKFILGCVMIWSIGSPISQVMMISSFSRLLGQKPQGVWQGVIAMGGSLGRIITPLIAGFFLLDCWGCPGQPQKCYFDPDSDGDYDGKDHTNYIFYIGSSFTFFGFFLLLAFKHYLTTRGKILVDMMNASSG